MTDKHGRLEAAAALLSQAGPEEPWMAGAAQMHQLFLVRYPALDGPGARNWTSSARSAEPGSLGSGTPGSALHVYDTC